uniref:Uncharacterized protein n=1 Tax=Micrococcus sp. V7 TaxID=404582 RepID=U5NWD6_9MICC|nr:hypothetical protein LMV7_p00010 [Micrococcus sp. V7]
MEWGPFCVGRYCRYRGYWGYWGYRPGRVAAGARPGCGGGRVRWWAVWGCWVGVCAVVGVSGALEGVGVLGGPLGAAGGRLPGAVWAGVGRRGRRGGPPPPVWAVGGALRALGGPLGPVGVWWAVAGPWAVLRGLWGPRGRVAA